MEFLGKLGIDIKLLIAQIINFGLLLLILKKFVYGPIVRRIEKDEGQLKEAEEEKEKIEKEKKEFEIIKERELTSAHQKAESIIAEAEAISRKIRERAEKESSREKEKVIRQIKARLKEISNGKK